MRLKVVVPRTRRVASIILLAIGLICLGIYSYSYLYRAGYQLYESWQFDHDSEELAPAPAPEKKPTGLPVLLPNPDSGGPRSLASIPDSVIGRISIPRLHLSAIVEEGVDDTTLSRAVGHIPGTALPGEAGNIGIAGHRDTFFRALKDLQPHDKIDFTTHSGRFHFTVESLRVVEPTDVSVLTSDGGQALTIVTCFPFKYIGNAPRRYIVHAVSE
jgi:sortase A